MDISLLTFFDYIVFSIIIFSAIVAFFRGFIQSLFYFLSWTGAIYLTIYFHDQIRVYLTSVIKGKLILDYASTLGLFICFTIILSFVSKFIIEKISFIRGGAFDAVFGAGFGVLRGVVMSCVVFVCIAWVAAFLSKNDGKHPKWLESARTYSLLKESSVFIADLLTTGTPYEKKVNEYAEKYIGKKLQEAKTVDEIYEDAEDKLIVNDK